MKKQTVTAATVTHIPVTRIKANPHNPRRLFDDEPMADLKESIQKLSILVPVTVYPEDEGPLNVDKGIFVLLDGERRWRCAKDLEMENVPAIIVDRPSDLYNILAMFHIHNVREGWQLMPIALKLQSLMRELKETNERKLASVTKLTISTVRRCKILLSYPKKFQDMMLAPVSERFKADFFIDLNRFRQPAIADRLPPWIVRGDRECIDIMIRKYEAGVIQSVTEFRLLASLYRGAQRTNQVKRFCKELTGFFEDAMMKITDIVVPGASFEKDIMEIGRSARRLRAQIFELDLEAVSSDEGTIRLLRELSDLIHKKLEKALLNDPTRGAKED